MSACRTCAEQAPKVDSTGSQLTCQALGCQFCCCYFSSCCEDSFQFCCCHHVWYVFLSFLIRFDEERLIRPPNLRFLAFIAPKVKKEFLAYAKVMKKMGSAKSPVVRGKGKARNWGKSTAGLIDLCFSSPKSSSTSWSQKRK